MYKHDGKHSDDETSVTNACMDVSLENNTNMTSLQRIDSEVRYASEVISNHEDYSTSRSLQLENQRASQQSRLPGNGERSKRNDGKDDMMMVVTFLMKRNPCMHAKVIQKIQMSDDENPNVLFGDVKDRSTVENHL